MKSATAWQRWRSSSARSADGSVRFPKARSAPSENQIRLQMQVGRPSNPGMGGEDKLPSTGADHAGALNKPPVGFAGHAREALPEMCNEVSCSPAAERIGDKEGIPEQSIGTIIQQFLHRPTGGSGRSSPDSVAPQNRHSQLRKLLTIKGRWAVHERSFT